MQDPGQARFDAAAKTWDENPARLKMAEAVVAAVAASVPVSPRMLAMDYGCGTGLVTLLLAPMVREIVGADSSPGMLQVLEQKIGAGQVSNARPLRLDLSSDPAPDSRFDLIVSNMTLHHVKEPPNLIRSLADLLRPGGYLCICDLDTEAGDFHQDLTGVHHYGFDRARVVELFSQAGLREARGATAHTMSKPVAGGEVKDFSIFLVTGRKEG